MNNIDFVMHVASPVPLEFPKDENEIIEPVVKGARNIINAAIKCKVRKLTYTSSDATIFPGNKIEKERTFNEKDWAVPHFCNTYDRSKIFGEQEILNIWKKNQDKIKITCINPGYVLGKSLTGLLIPSTEIIKLILNKETPFCMLPEVQFSIVDVNDVALAHLRAIQYEDETNGKRYLLSCKSLWYQEIREIIQNEFQKYNLNFPKRNLSKFVFKIYALFDQRSKYVIDFLGKKITFDHSESEKDLKINYSDVTQSIIDTCYSLIEHKFVNINLQQK